MTDEQDLGPRLSRRLTYLLKHALLTLEQLHDEHLRTSGIDARELAVLLTIGDREPESQQQVSQRLRVDRTTMVGLLDGLEHKRLVTRRADQTDRRRNVVELTSAGQRLLEEALRASDAAERQLLAGLDERDAASLRELLAQVAATGRL